jgi:hypothetical protein
MTNKTIKISFEIPSKILEMDYLDGYRFLGDILEETLRAEIKKTVIEKILPSIEIPKIEITASEVKDRMLEIKAREALDR